MYEQWNGADLHRENMKKKRREIDQAMDAASDLLDTDSNATFAMVFMNILLNYTYFTITTFTFATLSCEQNIYIKA